MIPLRSTPLALSSFTLLLLAVACGDGGAPDDATASGGAGTGSAPGVGGTGIVDGGGGTTGTGSVSGAGGIAGTGSVSGTGGIAGTGSVSGSGGDTGTGAQSGTGAQVGAGGIVEGAGGEAPEVDLDPGVEFSPPAASFQTSIDVTLSAPLGGSIHYTTDGTVPTADSAVYAAPLSLTGTTQIRAIAIADGAQAGDAASAVYLAIGSAITSDIPIVVLDNYLAGPVVEEVGGIGQPAGEREYYDATFMSFPLNGDGVANLLATPEVATRAAFRVRGQSSATFEKTPYKVELRDNDESDKKFPVFGMPKQSDWVLRGPYADKSLIRDAFFYSLGTEMGMQAPKFVMAEFYLNTDNATVDESDYMGVYIFSESVKVAKQRLDLVQLSEADTQLPEITGGYLFKFEWKVEIPAEQKILCTGAAETCWADLEVADPDPLNIQQNEWLTGHINEFHTALFSTNWTDAAAGYAPYIDVASFIDQLIINELGREMDSYVRSAYFHKDRDGLITAGPLWDYNLSFGVGGFFGNRNTKGWQYIQNCSDDDELMQADLDLGADPEGTGGGTGFPPTGGLRKRVPGNNWFLRMMDDPAFVNLVKARWQALRGDLLSDAALNQRVTDLTVPLTNAAARNFQKWNTVLDTEAIGVGFITDVGPWDQQVDLLRSWMLERAAWLDTQWGQ